MAKLFFEVLVFLDEKANHPLWDLLNNTFDKENNGIFWDKVFYSFCAFSWDGYNHTHPEEFN